MGQKVAEMANSDQGFNLNESPKSFLDRLRTNTGSNST